MSMEEGKKRGKAFGDSNIYIWAGSGHCRHHHNSQPYSSKLCVVTTIYNLPQARF
jgi:hypothetical protein